MSYWTKFWVATAIYVLLMVCATVGAVTIGSWWFVVLYFAALIGYLGWVAWQVRRMRRGGW